MEQLVFVGIILVFTILEAMARKRRASPMEGEEAPSPEEVHPPRPRPRPRAAEEPSAGTVPRSYDEEASFDEAARGDEVPRREEPRPLEVPRPVPAPEGSEGLIPPDVWDEIRRMARGEAPSPPARTPEGKPPVRTGPKPSRARPAGKARPSVRAGAPSAQPRGKPPGERPAPVRASPAEVHPVRTPEEGTAEHWIHAARESFGVPPSLRQGAPLQLRAPEVSARAEELRKLLLAGDRGSLRQAVILQEVLGPPQGLKELRPGG